MEISAFKSGLLPFLKTLWAPPTCELCPSLVAEPPDLCEICRRRLNVVSESCCSICAIPFIAAASSEHRCSECLADPPAFDQVFSAFLFQGAAGELLRAGKFGRQARLFGLLAQLAAPAFAKAVAEFQPDWLCPMPLSWRRSLIRGFNQSVLLTLQLKKKTGLGLPVLMGVSRKHSAPQATRSREQRLGALKKVFKLRGSRSLAGKKVLVVDDVMTTGATAQALAICLKRAQVASVGVFAAARVAKASAEKESF